MNIPRLDQNVKPSKALSRLNRSYPDLEPLNDLLRTPPQTTEDRLLHIAALGQRIQEYIKFMDVIGNMAGSSIEAKELAIVVFHDCLAALEPQLGNIPEELGCYSSLGKRG
jgi:hypothetical protein